MKKNRRLSISFRSFILAALLFSLAGCTSLGEFIDWLEGKPSSSTSGGCFGPGGCYGKSGGCTRKTFELTPSPFGSVGHQRSGDNPSARDMGISQELSEFPLINPSSSHDN